MLGLLSAGLGAVGSLIGNIGKAKKDRKAMQKANDQNIAFQRETNLQNKKWADESWDKTNAYNTPAMQMARFKEAGLNPHLIYGQGSEVGQQPATSGKAPEVNVLPSDTTVNEIGQSAFNAAQSYVANKLQQTQINNMEKQNSLIDANIVNTNASTANTLANTARTSQQTSQSAQLWTNTVAQAEANLNTSLLSQNKIKADILSSEAGTRLSNAQIDNVKQSISESGNRIKLMQIEGNNKAIDTELKKLDVNLKRQGINPQDPAWMRIIGQLLDPTTVKNYIKKQNERLETKIPWNKR